MRLDDPAQDIQAIAAGLGCTVVVDHQVKKVSDLKTALQKAVQAMKDGKPVVLDVQVRPDGYSSVLEKAK